MCAPSKFTRTYIQTHKEIGTHADEDRGQMSAPPRAQTLVRNKVHI